MSPKVIGRVLIAHIGRGILELTESAHSRDQEYAADSFGLRHVHRIYGKTDGAFEFFDEVSKKETFGYSKVLEILNTHPLTPERLDRLRKLAQKLK